MELSHGRFIQTNHSLANIAIAIIIMFFIFLSFAVARVGLLGFRFVLGRGGSGFRTSVGREEGRPATHLHQARSSGQPSKPETW